MNTQRPEWNDANNALVGYGLSMVTLAHLRRYLQLIDETDQRPDGRGAPRLGRRRRLDRTASSRSSKSHEH